MAICGTCGNESARVRTVFAESGESRDQCPSCDPQTFEKFTAPSDKKIWIGPEVRPNDYEKKYDSEGVYYEPKPEATAELERNLFVSTEEKEKYERALAKKRTENRQGALTPEQIAEALKRADAMVRPLIEDKERTFIV